MSTGANTADLDFDSVQRGNAEIQRRAQEVIDRCWALGAENPILSIHDVGAGGLSNALPELAHGAGRGARIDLRAAPNEEPGMTPREVWCNEAQERYVLAIAPRRASSASAPSASASAARSPWSGAPPATTASSCTTRCSATTPVDMDLPALLGKPPRMTRDVARVAPRLRPFDTSGITLAEAVDRVLRAPAVADKTFLISIGDRTVGGLCSRDQCVGPWQVPVADCATTLLSFEGYAGEAFAIGERTPLAAIDAPASGRMAVAEALTNLAAAPVTRAVAREALGELDGGGRRAGRGRGAVRHGARRRARPVPRARRQHPRRQGLDVDAHDVGRRRQPRERRQPGLAHRLGVRARATTCAARGRRSCAPMPGRPTLVLIDLARRPRAARRRRCWRRCTAQTGDEAPDVDDPAAIRGLFAALARAARRPASCSPTTTGRTAACSSPCSRWRSRATSASTDRRRCAVGAGRR